MSPTRTIDPPRPEPPPRPSTALVKASDYEELLISRRDRLDALLTGTDLSSEKFIGMTIQALARDPKLLAPDIDRQSLLLAILSVAEMGLVPSGPFGGAWLVPFRDRETRKKKVTPIIDWRAFIKMALESGQIGSAYAHVVYQGDEFSVELGDRPRLTHRPTLTPDERGNLTHAYAVAVLANGATVFEVMTADEIDHVRRKSRASDDGPWVSDPTEMARKTVVRRLFKYIPVAVTPRLAAALVAEDRWEDERGGSGPIPTTTEEAISSRRARVLRSVGVPVADDNISDGAESNNTSDEAASPTQQPTGPVEQMATFDDLPDIPETTND